MQAQIIKWALVFSGILLLGLVGWWLWPSPSPAVSNQNQTAPNGTQYPSRYTVTSAQGGSQASTSLPATDIPSAYASLFSRVGAAGLEMNQVDSSSSGDNASIYALYAQDVAISKELYPRETSYSTHMAFTDLNEDGANEAIVYVDLPGSCGTAGCPFDIYQKQAGTWSKIFSTVMQGEVGLLNVYISGYRSLLLTSSTGGPHSNAVAYAWDGKTYQPGTVVATWTGTAFVLRQ